MLHTNILILQGFCQFSKWYIVICSVQQSLKLCMNRWHARSSLFNDGVAEHNALQKCAPSLISQEAVVAASKIVTKLDSKAFHAWIRSSTVVDLWERSKHSTAAVAPHFTWLHEILKVGSPNRIAERCSIKGVWQDLRQLLPIRCWCERLLTTGTVQNTTWTVPQGLSRPEIVFLQLEVLMA